MKKGKVYRYFLQIQFRGTQRSMLMRSWDINEPFSSLSVCKRMAEGMLDDTVEKMQIADAVKNNIYKQYR